LPDQQLRQPARRAWLPWTLCLLLAGTSVYLSYLAYHRPEQEPAPPAAGEQSLRTGAPVATASSGEVALEAKGYIIPAHQILVSPKVSGMIVKLLIEEGQRVQKDQMLAQLETIEYKADRDRARASTDVAWQRFVELYTGHRPEEVRQAKAELEEMEAQLQQLHLDWQRTTRLQPTQALAQKEYELAYSSYKAMERRVERLRQSYKLMVEGPRAERIQAAWAEWQQADADLTKAQWRLDNCTIRAPVSGTILTKKAEEGNIVNPSAFSNGLAASVCEMADLSDLEVELDIQERDIAKVQKGQRCLVRPEAFPDRVYPGTVDRLMPTANRAKGAIPVRVKVQVSKDEEGVYLKPEMGAVVSFMKSEK
jgi:multidrug resistance efflux pump